MKKLRKKITYEVKKSGVAAKYRKQKSGPSKDQKGRMYNIRIVKKARDLSPMGRRSPGRPKKRWKNVVE